MPRPPSQPDTSLERSARAFAHEHLRRPVDPPTPDQAPPAFDRDTWDACAEFGLLALPLPEEYDGLGNHIEDCVTAVSVLARESSGRDNGLLFAASAHTGGVALPLSRLHPDPQRRALLRDLARGTHIAGVPLVRGSGERNDGAVVRATRSPDGLVLDGLAPMVCNAPIADVLLLWADTSALAEAPDADDTDQDPDASGGGLETAFLVSRRAPGLQVLAADAPVGLLGAQIADVRLTACPVDPSAIVGTLHQGREVRHQSFSWHTSLALAALLGRMEWQLEAGASHARARQQFGRAIGHFQAVGHRLADLSTNLELGRVLVRRLARSLDRGDESLLHAARARAFVTPAYIDSSRALIQIYGGQGYMRDTGLVHDMSDALVAHVYLGTSEVPRDIIAHFLGLGPLE